MAALYARMTQPEVQVLVVLDKWLATLTGRVQGELDRVSQQLTGRIKQLAERYAKPLPLATGAGGGRPAGQGERAPEEDGVCRMSAEQVKAEVQAD